MTRMYKTTLHAIVPVEVEAESDEEAERIIDGVIKNVVEGEFDCPIDMLSGKPTKLERDKIERA